MDRSEINRALAKAMAYKACGKDYQADIWTARLVTLLETSNILTDNAKALARHSTMAEG